MTVTIQSTHDYKVSVWAQECTFSNNGFKYKNLAEDITRINAGETFIYFFDIFKCSRAER